MRIRNLPSAVILLSCTMLLLLNPIVLLAQLRAGADGRGISIGAAVNMSPFRNEPIYTQTLSREFNLLVARTPSSSTPLNPPTTALTLLTLMLWLVSRRPIT